MQTPEFKNIKPIIEALDTAGIENVNDGVNVLVKTTPSSILIFSGNGWIWSANHEVDTPNGTGNINGGMGYFDYQNGGEFDSQLNAGFGDSTGVGEWAVELVTALRAKLREYRTDWIEYVSPLVIPSTWDDATWHNDELPSFEVNGYRVWIDAPDSESRFAVQRLNADGEIIYDESKEDNDVLRTNDFAAVVELVSATVTELCIRENFADMPVNPHTNFNSENGIAFCPYCEQQFSD